MKILFPLATEIGTLYLTNDTVYSYDGKNWIDINDKFNEIPYGTVSLWANSHFTVPKDWTPYRNGVNGTVQLTIDSCIIPGVNRLPILDDTEPLQVVEEITYLPPTFCLSYFIKLGHVSVPTPAPIALNN